MSTRVDQLDQLRHEVNLNLAFGAVSDIDLVTNDEGHCPVVVALDSEPLSAILGRLRAVGGYGTVFSRGKAGVRAVSMLHDQCAIPQPADSLIPGPDAEFGMFLDYVARHDDGVCIPAAFDHPAKARDARPVELAEA
ncbi:hypothetical protein [Gordonia sp. (in: high G+C Gram-positive bacteria)]|jgi:hypothetical protein|uniref:hypothetical protein n=1 Tax=Gordonia sp. (in: high G+C Gram-positive bacteria) TaxID=84139 RepID=UPI00391A85CE